VIPQLRKQQRISVKLGLADTLASGAKNRAQSVAVLVHASRRSWADTHHVDAQWMTNSVSL